MQDGTQNVHQDVHQGVHQGRQVGTQGGTQENDNITNEIINKIKNNPKIKLAELAKEFGLGLRTIKRYIKNIPNIKYVGSGYSGHWEIING